MINARQIRLGVLLTCMTGIFNACQSPQPITTSPKSSTGPINNTIKPSDTTTLPEVTPLSEPLSKRGNPAFYEVDGVRYFVKSSAAGYVERGVASWYGPGFHQEFTSNGEPYDMYGLTAAHKTLPLPCYVQVTNLTNGKQVVLRVNDRGPFKAGRIIDLSYTAAAKLDMLRDGTALVEVRAITPGEITPTPNDAIKPIYVQAGSFSNAINADRLVSQLRKNGYPQTDVFSDLVDGRSLYRVRIGPIPTVNQFDEVVEQLKALGIADARLASD